MRNLLRRISMREYTNEAKVFYGSRVWKKCREEYKKSVGGLCERCLKNGLVEAGYIVHHKAYIDASNITDPKILLNFDNLELLCMNCHNAEHAPNKKRYVVMPDGKVFATPPSEKN